MMTTDYWQQVAQQERAKNKLLLEMIATQTERIRKLETQVQDQQSACEACREAIDD